MLMKEFWGINWKFIKRNFQFFVCGNPTSIKALDKDEESEVRPSETTQEEEM